MINVNKFLREYRPFLIQGLILRYYQNCVLPFEAENGKRFK